MKTRITAAVLFALAAMSADAAEEADFRLETAANLARLCGAPSDPSAIHMCQGYLLGVHHMHHALDAALGVKVYCLPADGGVTRDTAARDFAAWVAANPDAGAMPAREGLLRWAQVTFPCQ